MVTTVGTTIQAERPTNELDATSLDSLDEVTKWLGTYRHRLRIAREGERLLMSETVRRYDARHQRRQAELA